MDFGRKQSTEAALEREAVATDDLGMIPLWSILLAIAAFVGIEYLTHFVLPAPRAGMMPMRLMMGYSSGTLVASYFLLMGYVSRDVKRRNMSAPLWMLIVILMPGGIGAVVYFLLRQPMLSKCPHCSTEIPASYHFCPQCQFQMAPCADNASEASRSPMPIASSADMIFRKIKRRLVCASFAAKTFDRTVRLQTNKSL